MFYFRCFFYPQNLFVKENNRFEIVSIDSIYTATYAYLLAHPSPPFPRPSYRASIYRHLFLPTTICENLFFHENFFYLWEFLLFHENSFWNFLIRENLFFLWKSFWIFLNGDNLFFLWKSFESFFISEHLFIFVRTLFYFFLWEYMSLWKQARVWMSFSETDLLSSKHGNDILLISYVPSLCSVAWILLILWLSIFLLKKVSLNSLNSVAIFTPFAV